VYSDMELKLFMTSLVCDMLGISFLVAVCNISSKASCFSTFLCNLYFFSNDN
jgi:hypothetical protein